MPRLGVHGTNSLYYVLNFSINLKLYFKNCLLIIKKKRTSKTEKEGGWSEIPLHISLLLLGRTIFARTH